MCKTNEAMKTYIHISKYARWIERLKRRETWEETVNRYVDFWKGRDLLDETILLEVKEAILNKKVMPSMRAMMTAGKALEKDELAGFNCSAIAVTHQAVFSEIFYILLCGAGAGFSVERQYIVKLPEISEEMFNTDTVLNIRDSKIGWATGLKELISMLYNGQIPKWDLSKIRPAGARLKTFGGRASGPAPLNDLFKKVVHVFNSAKGRKLTSIECHDILCHIAESVIVGGVRRAALISLSNLTDDRMRRAKDGQWWITAPQRALANNSVAYTEKPDLDSFSKEWRTLYKSKSGERGIWNKVAAKKVAEKNGREYDGEYLTNPCGETILRDTGGLCNLSSVVIGPIDSFEEIKGKVRLATIIGTLQSTLVNFRFLRSIWSKNAEEERLLGVSFTGIMDHKVFSNQCDRVSEWTEDENIDTLEKVLSELRLYAHEVNAEYAALMGINKSGHIGVVKPEGTASLLTGTSSGIHPRYAPYYIRRVRNDKKDPLSQLMIDEGIPYVEDGDKYIFSFYIKSPDHSVIQKDIGAMQQLEIWKIYKNCWTDGNPSQTIYYLDDDYFQIAAWLWKNWDDVGGLSFFPYTDASDGVYKNAPLEAISKEDYEVLIAKFPENIKWENLHLYEKEDFGEGTKTLACAGGSCELI